jgi:hypothetical protein
MGPLAMSKTSKDELIAQLRQELYDLKTNYKDIDGLIEESN